MSLDLQTKQDYARQLRLARSKFRRINSLDLIPEDQENMSDEICVNTPTLLSRQNSEKRLIIHRKPSALSLSTKSTTISSVCYRMALFWPNLLANLFNSLLRCILYIPLSIAAPGFWLFMFAFLLWIFWKLLRIPVLIIKWMMTSSDNMSTSSKTAKKRTILISCGSTIQTLHLARNFYSSGARVIVFDFEGLFGLARFSTAVDKFYAVPRPTPNNVENYIAALCQIVKNEKPSVYIPVCATSPAYYDSLAKAHLELLGCASFIPGLQETIVLDDCLQFYQKCAAQNIQLPPYNVLSSIDDLWHLYESGFISNYRNILMAVGMQGLLERYKYILPNTRRDLKFNHEINEREQWMIVRDLPGEHFVTCTTVKDSRVVANVTCKVEHKTKNLIPITHLNDNKKQQTENNNYNNNDGDIDDDDDAEAIDKWVKTFFAKVRFQRSINGHISFRLIKCQGTRGLLPLGVRLGVSLPYICYNRSYAQTLCRQMKCVHMRHLSLIHSDDESTLSALSSGWRLSAIEKSTAAAALDKREALFAYWDPLPYCAYYHFQLPLESVKMFLQKRHGTTKTLSQRITIPVH